MNYEQILMKFDSILKIIELFVLMILGITLSGLFIQFFPEKNTYASTVNELRAMLFIQSACIFLFTSISFSILNREKWAVETHLLNVQHRYNKYVYAITILLVFLPFVSLLSELNQQIKLPSNFADLEAVMKNSEMEAQEFTNKILNDASIEGLFLNLFVVAFFAAFTEEIFFRGTFQRILRENLNYHAAIIIVAVVFSFLHFQFYGFLPRLFLGILLGYIYEYGRNLWYAIAVHFVNNAMVVILNWGNPHDRIMENMNTKNSILLAIFGVISLYFSIMFIRKFRNE